MGSSRFCSAVSRKEEYEVVISRTKKIFKNYKCFDFEVVSEYCPSSIYDYLNVPKRFNETYCDDLRNNARKHLSALGWKFWSKVKNGKDEWRYESPTKTYYSLRTACQAIANGNECNTIDGLESNVVKDDVLLIDEGIDEGNVRKKNRRKLRKQKRNEDRWDEKLVSKKRKVLFKVRSSDAVGEKSSRGLSSSKQIRQICVGSSSSVSGNPMTVLSWMIEKNAVALRSKVFYFKKNRVEPLGEGRVFKEGIRCGCCQNLFSLSGFQAHVTGNNILRPAENLFLEDGKSLVDCQVELMHERMRSISRESVEENVGNNHSEIRNDDVCSICQYGGDIVLCDRCPSSYHSKCLNLPGVPEDEWFCPLCCCAVCGGCGFNDDAVCCLQCERRYHSRCKEDRGVASPGENWFCCNSCEMIHWGLQQLFGKPILVSHDGLTCTMVKPMHNQAMNIEDSNSVAMAEIYSKLGVAYDVLHECFETVKDPWSGRDVVKDALFCKQSKLNRLNFKGFYTVLLERNDELISVASLRIFGDKVAEVPLIGTCSQHRRLGMCRILMNEIEKMLRTLGVQKLVLPAAPSVLDTWTTAFGFSPMTESDLSEFIGYSFWYFQNTTMCQKLLRKLPSPQTNMCSTIVVYKENNKISEDFGEEKGRESDTVDEGSLIDASPVSLNRVGGQQHDKSCLKLKFYKRKQELGPSVNQTTYSLSRFPSISVK